jgi:hypothetical protein
VLLEDGDPQPEATHLQPGGETADAAADHDH